jgi:hypothetical protein
LRSKKPGFPIQSFGYAKRIYAARPGAAQGLPVILHVKNGSTQTRGYYLFERFLTNCFYVDFYRFLNLCERKAGKSRISRRFLGKTWH